MVREPKEDKALKVVQQGLKVVKEPKEVRVLREHKVPVRELKVL